MRTMISAVVSLAFAGTLFSAEALQIKSFADIKDSKKITSYVKNIPGGIRVTNQSNYVVLESVKQIPVDLKKKYLFSCEYRLAPGSKTTGRFYLAPITFDNKGRMLSAVTQYCVPGSETVLAAPVKKGAKVIKIKNGAKWITQWGFAAFDIKPKGADLPNFNVAAVAGVKKNGAVWDVALKTPIAKAYPAGVAVREQRAGATYRYMIGYAQPKAQWQKFSRVLTGAKDENTPGKDTTWRLGTVKTGIIFFTSGKVDMELRNVSIKEVK